MTAFRTNGRARLAMKLTGEHHDLVRHPHGEALAPVGSMLSQVLSGCCAWHAVQSVAV